MYELLDLIRKDPRRMTHVAEAAELDPRRITNWRIGESDARIDTFVSVANVLGSNVKLVNREPKASFQSISLRVRKRIIDTHFQKSFDLTQITSNIPDTLLKNKNPIAMSNSLAVGFF